MRFFISITLVLLIYSCSSISTELYEEIGYRESPIVELIEHDSFLDLQKACGDQHGYYVFLFGTIYLGCSWIPFDENEPCIINMMRDDETRFDHEYKHCQGFKCSLIPGL